IPPAAKTYITLSSGAHTKITRNPDAMFILNLGGRRWGYLYEKDKGTESHAVIAAKLLCYLEWYKRGLHKRVFGTKDLRILIETESNKRVSNMLATLAKINERGS
ncbi:MAG: hypothetical protein GWO38_21600, partial [Phycisphaerae bacterium]|nr:hypothetical protein [Phycisphaerae bacterium]NIX30160.1 hypothetical protein [Phycisphaerae bacterium]